MKRSRLSRKGSKVRPARLHVVKQWVRTGYFGSGKNEEGRALEFKTEEMTPDEASDVVKVVQGYNNYNGVNVSNAIKRIRNLVGSVQFGREYSPVIYVSLPYWTNQKAYPTEEETANPRKFTDYERKQMAGKVMAELKKAKPDELDFDEGLMRIRAWWD